MILLFRYFTAPFAPVEDANSRSWLTMALLGFKKDLATSTSTLAEEEALEVRLGGKEGITFNTNNVHMPYTS